MFITYTDCMYKEYAYVYYAAYEIRKDSLLIPKKWQKETKNLVKRYKNKENWIGTRKTLQK
jgi:hypothetical protein